MDTTKFALPGAINLQGRIGHGSFTVNEQDGLTEATVTLATRNKNSDIAERTVVELDGPTLVVMTPRQGGVFDLGLFGGDGDSHQHAIDITVSVPSGTAVRLSAVTADVAVNGRSGSADIAAGSSAITLDHVDGDLRLRSGSGSARVSRVSGSVEARSGAGDTHYGEIGGSLTSGCGSGDLDVGAVHGSVRSRAGSGSASLAAVYGDVDVVSGSGRLAIGLPAGRTVRLDVTTGSGRVNSELPVDDAPTAKDVPITVRARTGSGDVRLFRAA